MYIKSIIRVFSCLFYYYYYGIYKDFSVGYYFSLYREKKKLALDGMVISICVTVIVLTFQNIQKIKFANLSLEFIRFKLSISQCMAIPHVTIIMKVVIARGVVTHYKQTNCLR